jgi:hypothetical protein
MFRLNHRATALLDSLIEKAVGWVDAQRETHRPAAFALPQPECGLIAPFFAEETLSQVRFRHVPQIENPAFLGFLEDAKAAAKPLDFSEMAGITFVDTVILSDAYFEETDLVSLLFHECVHVAQYNQLGVEGFMRRYVEGWAANGMNYFAIPLERDAYELERQFRFAPHRAFSVEEAVALRLKS